MVLGIVSVSKADILHLTLTNSDKPSDKVILFYDNDDGDEYLRSSELFGGLWNGFYVKGAFMAKHIKLNTIDWKIVMHDLAALDGPFSQTLVVEAPGGNELKVKAGLAGHSVRMQLDDASWGGAVHCTHG